jgi:hypothetical protein
MRACLAMFVMTLVPAVARAGQDVGVELGGVLGEFRVELQSLRDPGSSSYRALGGLRVPIRLASLSTRDEQ